MKAGVHSQIQPCLSGVRPLPTTSVIRGSTTHPILGGDNPLPACLVQPPAPMPVPHDPRGILADDPPQDGEQERSDEREGLLLRVRGGVASNVERPNGVCGCNGAGEGELELEDVEAAERHREEYSNIGTADRKGDQPPAGRSVSVNVTGMNNRPKVRNRVIAQKTELVRSRKPRREQETKRACGLCRSDESVQRRVVQ